MQGNLPKGPLRRPSPRLNHRNGRKGPIVLRVRSEDRVPAAVDLVAAASVVVVPVVADPAAANIAGGRARIVVRGMPAIAVSAVKDPAGVPVVDGRLKVHRRSTSKS